MTAGRAARRLVVALLAALGTMVFTAAPAAAHAELVETRPGADEVVPEPPAEVTLRFTESVDVPDDAVRLLDATGQPVETPDPVRAGAVVTTPLPDLADGSYVVVWRVVSSDGHPIQGALTFHVGAPTPGGAVADVAAGALDRGSRATGVVFDIVRFAVFASLCLLVGGVAVSRLVWGDALDRPAVQRAVRLSLVVAVVATVAAIGLEGAYTRAGPLTDAVRPSVVADVLGTRFGQASTGRLVLLALAAPMVAALGRIRESTGALVSSGVVGISLLATVALAGHAATGDLPAFGMALDITHLVAVSLWLAGLVIAVMLLADPGHDREALRRFSAVAFWSVVVIVATGTLQSVRQVGDLDGLDTTYGRVLLVKVGFFAVLVVVAAASRRMLHGRLLRPVAVGPGALAASDGGRLRAAIGVEVALGVAVFAVTSLLVNAPPAKSVLDAEALATGPFATEVHTELLLVGIRVDPPRTGPSTIAVTTSTHAGAPTDPAEVRVELRLESRDLGPLDVALRRVGPGRYTGATTFPFPGSWEVAVVARTTEIDQTRARTIVPVR